MQFQIARARALYASAQAGIPSLAPSGRFATILASELYSGILCEIEAMQYDVFAGRARVPARGKARRVASAAAAFAGMWLPDFVPVPRALPTGDGIARRIGG
jgi:phytoene/squalene synthetase